MAATTDSCVILLCVRLAASASPITKSKDVSLCVCVCVCLSVCLSTIHSSEIFSTAQRNDAIFAPLKLHIREMVLNQKSLQTVDANERSVHFKTANFTSEMPKYGLISISTSHSVSHL